MLDAARRCYATAVPIRALTSSVVRHARAELALDADSVSLLLDDGHTRQHRLDGCAVLTIDATCQRRFVRLLLLECSEEARVERSVVERLTLMTPPEFGAIAPPAARVPPAPPEAVVVESESWEVLASWLAVGGRLAACSLGELARLSTIASPLFAAIIGEVAAEAALEAVLARVGALRGGHTVEDALRPFYEAARRSPRAMEALLAALARTQAPPRARRVSGW